MLADTVVADNRWCRRPPLDQQLGSAVTSSPPHQDRYLNGTAIDAAAAGVVGYAVVAVGAVLVARGGTVVPHDAAGGRRAALGIAASQSIDKPTVCELTTFLCVRRFVDRSV